MKTGLVVTAGVTAAVLVIGGGGGAYLLLRTKGSQEETTAQFLSAWSSGDYAKMKSLVIAPPADFEQTYKQFQDDLSVKKLTVVPGQDGQFTATVDGLVDWQYQGGLKVIERDRAWKVQWDRTAVHPKLTPAARFKITQVDPQFAPITSAEGTRIDTPTAPGSVQQLVADLQKTFAEQLTGSAGSRVDLVENKKVIASVAKGKPTEGKPLQTTIDLSVHKAAAKALENVSKPASLVALKASTGEILSVANKPGGFNRALLGKYPPGSTFKVVTASALVAGGVTVGQQVKCPAEQNIGGFKFHNAHFKDYGTLRFSQAFAHSCNTAFGFLGATRLGDGKLAKVAESFGFGASVKAGVPVSDATFPTPKDTTDLASASIGQGRVTASPLNMAAVAAAIKSGTWRPPRLVAADLVQGGTKPRQLDPAVVRALRTLMPAVVNEGTASKVAFPAGTGGKTGTAESGAGEHSWFIGYRGDIAFAVLVEGAGAGAKVAAPAAATFLKNL